MARRLIALALGLAFGVMLSWGGMTSPDRIRAMLLLSDGYLWWMFFTAVAVAFVGLRLVRRAGAARNVLTLRPERRHVVGSALFGLGWAVADVCPGPIVAQLGQGLVWSLFTLLGMGIGIELHAVRQRRAARALAPETAPAAETL
jgi:uncharacterized membrane protein YedE/YeeE